MLSILLILPFLISHRIQSMQKEREYCNRMIEKKSLLLMNVHVLYVLELKTIKKKKQKNSVCLSVDMYVRYTYLPNCNFILTYVDSWPWTQ